MRGLGITVRFEIPLTTPNVEGNRRADEMLANEKARAGASG
jgi:hypothetical protein